MNAGIRIDVTRLATRVFFAAAVVAAAGSGALGQVRAQGGSSDDRGFGGVPSQAPRPMPGLGGVRSEAPRPLSGINPPRMSLPGPNSSIRGVRAGVPGPISGLGGTPAALPQTQALGPIRRDPRFTEPQFRPMEVGPWRSVPSTPAVERPLRPSAQPPIAPPMAPAAIEHPRTPVIVLPDQRFVVVDGSGLTVDAHYRGDRFRLGLHLGSHPEFIALPIYPGYGFGGLYGHYYGTAGWWSDYGSYHGCNSYITGAYEPIDHKLVDEPMPAEHAATEPPPANDKEAGDLMLRWGDVKGAVRAYKAWLKSSTEDYAAMRALGLAQIEEGKTKEGVAMIALAYKTNPALALVPASIDTYRGGAKEWRDNLNRASVYANSTGSASAWLTVAVFMQSEGRNEQARAMVDRASAAGLDPAVVAGLRAALMD
jgi:hypothetical protein